MLHGSISAMKLEWNFFFVHSCLYRALLEGKVELESQDESFLSLEAKIGLWRMDIRRVIAKFRGFAI